VSEDGNTYYTTPFVASEAVLSDLWQKAQKFKFLFSDMTEGNEVRFRQHIISPGVVLLNIYQEDVALPIGLAYMDRLRPKMDAHVHYLFWDQTQKGRHRLLLSLIRWAIDEFEVHRVNIEVPEYAYSALRRMQRMGIRLEGRRRGAVRWREQWKDILTFGVVDGEISDEAIKEARLARKPAEDNWFGLLEDGSVMSTAVLREKR